MSLHPSFDILGHFSVPQRLRQQAQAKIEVGFRIAGMNPECRFKFLQRFRIARELQQGCSKIVVQIRIVGSKLDRPAKSFFRLREILHQHTRQTKII